MLTISCHTHWIGRHAADGVEEFHDEVGLQDMSVVLPLVFYRALIGAAAGPTRRAIALM